MCRQSWRTATLFCVDVRGSLWVEAHVGYDEQSNVDEYQDFNRPSARRICVGSKRQQERPPGAYRPGSLGTWGIIRGTLGLASSWSLLAVLTIVWPLLAILSFRIGVSRYRHHFMNLFGRIHLFCVGVKLRVIDGTELEDRKSRVITFNHCSSLDMFIGAALAPPGGLPLMKREILYIPILGWGVWAFGMPTVDRSRPSRARASLSALAKHIRDESGSLMIAPEGTRSADGSLGPFKMGAFHLANDFNAPILPMVIRGAHECLPLGTFLARPGIIEIEVLKPIAVDVEQRKALRQCRDQLRELYMTALGESEDPPHGG